MILDIIIFCVYILVVLGIGFYYFRRNETSDDYYVAGRNVNHWHVGLSVVATDVGGGFSIGLGGLGFAMGLSGSWLLFTGLVGAWVSAVVLIPRIYALPGIQRYTTLPEIFEHFYGSRVALLAGIITTIGYLSFTSSQIIAGAKLATGTFEALRFEHAVILMGAVAVGYTILGGLKAVIYTDTAQWLILMAGLLFAGVPFAFQAVGGWEAIRETVRPEMLTLTNVSWQQLVNWAITIVPIWFVGMTLYQRIFASRNEKSAKKAWFIAGLFEWPVMAFLGVALGLLARVALDQGVFLEMGITPDSTMDEELGLPILLRTVLPTGIMGLVLAAYFSAVMSTADSCLMASSGSFLTDILRLKSAADSMDRKSLRYSQWTTLGLGVVALLIALALENVLEAMLFSYAFMVSGLLVPILGGFFWKKSTAGGAFGAMIAGGLVTTTLTLLDVQWFGLDPNLYGILSGTVIFILLSKTENRDYENH